MAEDRTVRWPDERDKSLALTVRQREVLVLCERYLRETGEPASVRYLARRLGVHPSTIVDHLEALARKNWLRTSTTPRRRV
jgi:DNA-binding MarR family transcriptional regulator